MCLQFALFFVKTILENYQWMVKLYVHPRAERTLLEFRKDMRIQYSPIWVQRERVQLIKLSSLLFIRLGGFSREGLGRFPGESQQLPECSVGLLTALSIGVAVGQCTHHLEVEVLVKAIKVLLDEIELAATHLHLHELVMLLEIFMPGLGTGALHWEVKHQQVHVEHVLGL